jgi:hypothetical protein
LPSTLAMGTAKVEPSAFSSSPRQKLRVCKRCGWLGLRLSLYPGPRAARNGPSPLKMLLPLIRVASVLELGLPPGLTSGMPTVTISFGTLSSTGEFGSLMLTQYLKVRHIHLPLAHGGFVGEEFEPSLPLGSCSGVSARSLDHCWRLECHACSPQNVWLAYLD